MRRVWLALLAAVCAGSLSFGQVSVTQEVGVDAIQTGFAVVTPLSPGAQGLGVSATFGELITGSLFQASVLPSPLVTLTSLFVNLDPSIGVNTGLAMVNPTDTATTVALSLMDAQGAVVATRTVTIGGRQQLSRFVTELLGGPGPGEAVSGVLFISSDVPIGVLGLGFNGLSFTALPVATQLSANSVVALGDGVNTFGTTTITTPRTFVFATPPVVPITGTPPPLVNSMGLGSPSAGTPIAAVPVVSTPALAPAATQLNTFGTFPEIVSGVGGPDALLLPQIAAGGGWVTQITIANSSPFDQAVRVDFFNSLGGGMALPFGSTIPNLIVPAGGVVVLDTLGVR
jgi:hypothetical protein